MDTPSTQSRYTPTSVGGLMDTGFLRGAADGVHRERQGDDAPSFVRRCVAFAYGAWKAAWRFGQRATDRPRDRKPG